MAEKGQIYVRLRSKTNPHEWFAHPELRPRLIAEAVDKGTNLSDVVNEILAAAVGVPYTPVRRKSSPEPQEDYINFKLTPELELALRSRYVKKWHDGVRYLLCAHFGLRVPAKVKQTRNRRPVAA